MTLVELLIVAALTLGVVLLLVRVFCQSATLRTVFIIVPSFILAVLVLIFFVATNPGPFAFLLPYQSLGEFKTTDAEGASWDVDVSVKYLSNMIPPGMLPRLRLVARSPKGRAAFTHDTGWRFGAGDPRPVPGGIEVFTGPYRGGLRFLLKDGQWSVAPRHINQKTSLWEDRLQGRYPVGMTRDALAQLVRENRTEELPDLKVDLQGKKRLQLSLDREAAFYVTYSAAGLVESIELHPRMRGTIDEIKGDIGGDLFPLVALIQGAPEMLAADPVGLIRAVNGLRAAGAERAAASLREYHRLTDPNAAGKRPRDPRKYDLEDNRLFIIIRLLFIPKEGSDAMPLIDMPWVRKPPQGETGCPLFPVVLENDFPLILWTRQLGGGSPQNPMVHLDWCLQNARLRDSDLEPQGSALERLETLLDSKLLARLFPEGELQDQRRYLRRQLIAAWSPLLPYPEEYPRSEAIWLSWVQEVIQREPRWDVAQQCYVRGRP